MTLEEAYNNLIEYYDGKDDSHEYIQESWAVFKQLQNTASNSDYAKCGGNHEHDISGSCEYRQCKKCGEYVAVG